MSRLKRLKHQSSTATLFDDQYTYNTASQISQIHRLRFSPANCKVNSALLQRDRSIAGLDRTDIKDSNI